MAVVSVVVRTFNSERTIADCLQSLITQDYPDSEILVVDDGSTDNTLQIIRTYGIEVLRNVSGGNPCNRGIQEAKGPIVAFIDDDCTAPPSWLARILKQFENKQVAAVGGEELAPSDSKYWPRCFEALRKIEKKFLFHWGAIEKISTCNVAYRRDAVMDVGGFSDYLFGGEETELNWRLTRRNWKVLFDPDLTVTHNRKSSLSRYYKQQFRIEFGAGQMVCMHPRFVKPSHMIIPGLLILLAVIFGLFIGGKTQVAVYSVVTLALLDLIVCTYAAILAEEMRLLPGILIASIAFILARAFGFIAGLSPRGARPHHW